MNPVHAAFFGNLAATLARAMTDTFAGIRYWDAAGFIVAQLVAVALVIVAMRVVNRNDCAYQGPPWKNRS